MSADNTSKKDSLLEDALENMRDCAAHESKPGYWTALRDHIEQLTRNLRDLQEGDERIFERLRAALELIAGTNGTECAMPRVVAHKALSGEPPSPDETNRDAEDAAKWRALRGSARITAMGAAGLGAHRRRENHYAHLTLNFWTLHDSPPDPMALEWLDEYVEIARRAQSHQLPQREGDNRDVSAERCRNAAAVSGTPESYSRSGPSEDARTPAGADVASPALDEGRLWSFLRDVLSHGMAIEKDAQAGAYPSYEHFSAHLDDVARKRAEEFDERCCAVKASAGPYAGCGTTTGTALTRGCPSGT